MRILLLVVCIMLTACSSTSNPVKSDNLIRSTGVGNTYEEAKNNAFREAIEYQVGVVIATERISYNDKLIKNEILAYSSAYVDDYNVISQKNIGNKVQVVVDVKLSLLRLSDRILSKGKDSKNLDGAKHDNQYKSFMENKKNGDKILESVLNDYPKRAFDIKQGNYDIKIDANRNLILTVSYTMSWNDNYILAFYDATKLLSDGELGFLEKNGLGKIYHGAVTIDKQGHYFNDRVIPLKIVYGMLDGNEPRINIELKDNNTRSYYSKCFTPSRNYDQFYGRTGTIYLNINSKASEGGKLSVNIHQNSPLAILMKNLFKIELSVIPKKLCATSE